MHEHCRSLTFQNTANHKRVAHFPRSNSAAYLIPRTRRLFNARLSPREKKKRFRLACNGEEPRRWRVIAKVCLVCETCRMPGAHICNSRIPRPPPQGVDNGYIVSSSAAMDISLTPSALSTCHPILMHRNLFTCHRPLRR